MAVAIVYLVRHGETNENRQKIMQGQRDTALNAAGLEQAHLTANALENVKFTAAHSSDLSRAVKTAETILDKHLGVALQKHKALRERYMGDMEGKEISAWKGSLPANMESAAKFAARADRWWKENVVRYAQAARNGEDPERILVVSHGGLMHVMVQGLIESRQVKVGKGVDMGRFRFPNASVSVIEVDENKKGNLMMFADTTHLEVELVDGNVDIVEENLY